MRVFGRFLKCAAVASASLIGSSALASANEVVCRLPRGGTHITFANEDTREAMAWGPGGFAIAPDGTYWIADTAARRLLHYGRDCQQLGVIEPKDVVGITALAVSKDSLYVLDVSAAEPTVLHLGLSGVEHGRHVVDRRVTGVALGERGNLLVESDYGARFEQLLDRDGRVARAAVAGLSREGVSYQASPADLSQNEAHTGTLTVGGRTVSVSVPNDLGGLRVLSVGSDGGFFAKLDEVALVSDFRVDQTVRRYDREGRLLGMARVPLAERYTYVQANVATAPDGDAFILHTTREGAEIQRLVFRQTLPSILPVVRERPVPERLEAHPLACRGAEDMALAGNHFADFVRGYSATNISGSCDGRTKPTFLVNANTAYRGVAYDWGGFDTVASYDSALYANKTAGDIHTAAVESCSVGVDCSGYVSHAWGTPGKHGTSTLPNISWVLPNRSSLAKGDILNCADSHVVMFDYYTSNGIFMWEATLSNNFDRAVHINREWAYFSACYVPRRYNSKC
ncbi:hypothetical protein POL68_10570 [Stigmatella sp. ncwal1]|uniref:Uncharacterized protein n=1 Tax=Stigmatella ashevillensis TaxID=2995309 RepID=A0ABT5D5G7_9BACT|nr:hypothetical protein [Stigmatella ashevillena]MDC0708910.1 hypothetical protein [Stigmatella ashevillena]